MISFDLKSGYHIDICPDHQTFFGFASKMIFQEILSSDISRLLFCFLDWPQPVS